MLCCRHGVPEPTSRRRPFRSTISTRSGSVTGGDLFVFRGRAGSLVKIIWHDGIGMSLYAKRLEKGRFVWPSAKDGMVSLTGSQLACLLDGIDWRNPQYSWRPQSAG